MAQEMHKYCVRIAKPQWVAYDFTIEAVSEEEAIQKAKDGNGQLDEERVGGFCIIENMDSEVEFVELLD